MAKVIGTIWKEMQGSRATWKVQFPKGIMTYRTKRRAKEIVDAFFNRYPEAQISEAKRIAVKPTVALEWDIVSTSHAARFSICVWGNVVVKEDHIVVPIHQKICLFLFCLAWAMESVEGHKKIAIIMVLVYFFTEY